MGLPLRLLLGILPKIQGGVLNIRCYGDCILGKNAKIILTCKRLCRWDILTHPAWLWARGGGHGGAYCAGGGSHATVGGRGQCRDAFNNTIYNAPCGEHSPYTVLHKTHLPLGSGGGGIQYPLLYKSVLCHWLRKAGFLHIIEGKRDKILLL